MSAPNLTRRARELYRFFDLHPQGVEPAELAARFGPDWFRDRDELIAAGCTIVPEPVQRLWGLLESPPEIARQAWR